MFGRQTVINSDNLQARCRANIGANVVMAVQAAHDIAAAVQVNHRRPGPGVNPAGHARDQAIFHHHPRWIAAMKLGAHRIINPALIGNRQAGGVGRIGRLAVANKAPSRGVDKALVIWRWHDERNPGAYSRIMVGKACGFNAQSPPQSNKECPIARPIPP